MFCYAVAMHTIPRLELAISIRAAASAVLLVEFNFVLDLFSLTHSSYCRSSGWAPQCWKHFWHGFPIVWPLLDASQTSNCGSQLPLERPVEDDGQ